MKKLEQAESRLLRIEKTRGIPGGGNRGATVSYFFECCECRSEFESKRKCSKFCSKKCSKSYYAARPRYKKCVECGISFLVDSSRTKNYSPRITCSNACAEIQRRKHTDYKCQKRRAKLSKAMKSTNRIALLHTAEYRKKAAPFISKAKQWVNNKGNAALGVSKTKRVATLISPVGKVYNTMCARQFVRDNVHLFAIGDTEKRKETSRKTTIEGNMSCKAMKGLESIIRGSRRVWKGWTCYCVSTTKAQTRLTGRLLTNRTGIMIKAGNGVKTNHNDTI